MAARGISIGAGPAVAVVGAAPETAVAVQIILWNYITRNNFMRICQGQLGLIWEVATNQIDSNISRVLLIQFRVVAPKILD
ncbi:hypothetical protein ZWY2020_045070 [Hordeum vulgare]|nr:hypothetical protein ZWY2020_045070 [Hordeum vulgare]